MASYLYLCPTPIRLSWVPVDKCGSRIFLDCYMPNWHQYLTLGQNASEDLVVHCASDLLWDLGLVTEETLEHSPQDRPGAHPCEQMLHLCIWGACSMDTYHITFGGFCIISLGIIAHVLEMGTWVKAHAIYIWLTWVWSSVPLGKCGSTDYLMSSSY